ncbi:MAG: EamA family transporter RarD [Deltaproteobacteria bacterium]|nr:EamA family transporter RarD [Deltaproteobacteria bacterium]
MGAPATDSRGGSVTGALSALAAFVMWGFAPVYFKSVGRARPLEVLSHRVVWSVALLAVAALLLRRPQQIRQALGGPRRWAVFLLTSLLISSNWLLYIWAVNAGHIVDSSLGYYINPLVNVLLGVIFLRERLSRPQITAVVLAFAGVASLIVGLGYLPWISLVLPLQFGLYGLVRKKANVDPLVGLLAETALLFPAALGFLLWLGARDESAFLAHGEGFALLLAFAGIMTALPLLLFLVGAQRLRLSTLGVIQYISPTCQLIAGVVLYREPFSTSHAVAFGLIWAGLALYTGDTFLALRRRQTVA